MKRAFINDRFPAGLAAALLGGTPRRGIDAVNFPAPQNSFFKRVLHFPGKLGTIRVQREMPLEFKKGG